MLRPLIIVFGFGLLMLFPAWEKVTHWLPDPPLDEKRLPLAPPQWRASPNLQTYLLGWQNAFNDRYAGRNLLIRLKTQLDYSLFSYSDRVYIGRDGWLFYRRVLDDEEPSVQALGPADLDRIIGQFRALREWLSARGIALVIIDNPLKDTFYSEMVPASAPRLPSPSRADEIRRRLPNETGALVIDVAGILNQLKNERTVFHRTDFHWNDPAAFVVAEHTVNRMAALIGRPELGWRIKLVIDEQPLTGGEASFMPLLRPPVEKALFVHHSWTDRTADIFYDRKPFELVNKATGSHPELLPPVVIIGDSFFDGMIRSGIVEHFSAVYRARIYQASLQDVLLHLPPGTRFMIVEFIAPAVGLMGAPLDYKLLDRAVPLK